MVMKKKWTKKDYESNARDFVATYGAKTPWDEWVYEYAKMWRDEGKPVPFDGDELISAIYAEVSRVD